MRVEHERQALEASHLFLQYYRENAEYLERTYDFVERLGISRVRAETVDAPDETRAALLDRFQRSRTIAIEPWSTRGRAARHAAPVRLDPAGARARRARLRARRAARRSAARRGPRRARSAGARSRCSAPREREVHAIQARCPHANGPLADGILAGGKVTCPLHAWKVDVATGEATSPAGNCDSVQTYAVELRGDEVWVDVPGGS